MGFPSARSSAFSAKPDHNGAAVCLRMYGRTDRARDLRRCAHRRYRRRRSRSAARWRRACNIAVETSSDGRSLHTRLQVVRGFQAGETKRLCARVVAGTTVISDGGQWFRCIAEQRGIVHERHVTGSDRRAARHPAFRWANTMLANIKNSLLATYRVVADKHLPRYLGAFAWRFNRRFVLKTRPLSSGMLWKSPAFLPRYQKFESISLQQTVRLSRDFSFLYRKSRQLPRGARPRSGGTAGRDAPRSSTSR
jgi:hypothetical protein